MERLILIKHAPPAIEPGAPAETWRLAPGGHERCRRLAEALAPLRPMFLASSPEPKARETAGLLGRAWGVLPSVRDGLEEQHRRTAPFLGPAAFRDAARALLARPAELVFGEETADTAFARFARAVDELLDEHPHGTLAIVTHGTVIALYVARRAGLDAWALWQQLGLPSAVVLDRPTHAVERIESPFD